jgi:hypothetical protein
MPIEMKWYNDEKTIYHAKYLGNWTWEELFASLDSANSDFDSVTHKIDVLQDWTHSGKLPPNIISNSRKLIDKMHPNSGISVMVGGNMLLMSMWEVFSKVYALTTRKQMFLFADTVEAGVKLIEDYRKDFTR